MNYVFEVTSERRNGEIRGWKLVAKDLGNLLKSIASDAEENQLNDETIVKFSVRRVQL